jgi:predicted SAM-dependent methyltransferase
MKKIKINMCCGPRDFGPDWIHIDGGTYDHLDHYNVNELPYMSNSVDLIYCSHAIEYWSKSEVVKLLREWKRTLKPNGILRLAVPDFAAMSQLYTSGKIDLVQIIGPLYGEMQMSNETIYHKMVYDFNSLSELLYGIGFKNVKRFNWRKTEHTEFDDHSQAFIPKMDKDNGTLISLNVECAK